MEVYFPGPMPNDDFFQALWQFRHDIVDRYASSVQVKNATVYLHFCDEHGREVTLRNQHGKPIRRHTSPGAYRSAADYYDARDSGRDAPRFRNVPLSPL